MASLKSLSQVTASTVAVGLPLVYLRRKQKSTLEYALKHAPAPPPRRRTGAPAAARFGLGNVAATPIQRPNTKTHYAEVDGDGESASPGMGELMSGISKVNASTAMLGAKAFGIATCLVGIGAFVTVWGIKAVLGVQNVCLLVVKHPFCGDKVLSVASFPGLVIDTRLCGSDACGNLDDVSWVNVEHSPGERS